MPAAVPIIAAVVTVGGALIEGNQMKKAQEGAGNAAKDQELQSQQAIADQKKKDAQATQGKANQASATQAGALAAIRAAMSTSTSSGGTVLTSGQGAAAAPNASKTLLGV